MVNIYMSITTIYVNIKKGSKGYKIKICKIKVHNNFGNDKIYQSLRNLNEYISLNEYIMGNRTRSKKRDRYCER